MKFKLLFCSGDVGGARAIVPIINLACSDGNMCYLVNNGEIKLEKIDPRCMWIDELLPNSHATMDRILSIFKPDVFLFSSSVADSIALDLAFRAKAQKIPIVHVLDNWTNYKSRLMLKSGDLVVPNIYTAMDRLSADGVISAGFCSDTVKITGSPALESVTDLPRFKLKQNKVIRILFVSEPVELDQGSDLTSPKSRGYTQYTVLLELLASLQKINLKLELLILPHPREILCELEHFWLNNKGSLKGKVVGSAERINVIEHVDGVIGMSSLLLYESWLRGFPVLSLQPSLKKASLRMLKDKQFLEFIERPCEIHRKTSAWIESLQNFSASSNGLIELELHRKASRNVLSLVANLLKSKFN